MSFANLRRLGAPIVVLGASLVCLLFAGHAGAAVTYWDPQGTTGANPFLGSMSGTWESNSWSTGSGGLAAPVAWIEGTAPVFGVHTGIGTPAYTITMNADHQIAGAFDGSLTPNSSDVTITGTGHWQLANAQGFNLNNASDGSLAMLRINVPIVDGSYASATTGQLIAQGNGQLFLNAANTYSGGNFTLGIGGTLLGYASANFTGIVNFNNNSSFGTGAIVAMRGISGSSGALVAENAGINIPNTLDFSQAVLSGGASNPTPFLNIVGSTVASGGTTFSGNVLLGNKAVNLGSGGTGNLVTLSGVISGTGSLTKFNNSTLALSGANTYTGSTTISAGTLQLGAAGVIPDASAVTVTGTLDMNGFNETIGSLAGAGGVTMSGNLTTGGANTSTSLSGVISGAGNLTKAGTGTQTFTGANTYTGSTTISAGAISLNGTATLGNNAPATAGTLNLAGGNLITTATRTASSAPIANPINMTANTVVSTTSTAGTVELNFSNSNIVGTAGKTLTFRNDAASGTGVFQPRFSGAGFTFASDIQIANGGFGTTVLQSFNTSSTTQTFSGIVSGTGSYRRTATTGGTGGDTVFTAQNTYSGGTSLNDGFIGFGSSTLGSITSGPIGTGTLTIGSSNNPGAYAFGGPQTVANPIAMSNNMQFTGSNDLTMSGNIALGAAVRTVTVTNSGATTLSGVISDTGGTGGITKAGSGNLIVSGSNTYSGNTRSGAGTLVVANSSALQNSTLDMNSADSGAVSFGAGLGTANIGGLTGSRNLSLDDASTAPVAANIGNNNSSTTYSGQLSGGGSLTKQGTGTLVLSGASLYSGGTTVSAGTLLANNTTGSATGSGAVTVNGGTFGGTGAVSGPVTVNNGGTLSPGASVAALATGALTFSTGANLLYEIDSSAALNVGADLLDSTGALAIAPGVTLTFNDAAITPGSVPVGSKFTMISYSGPWDGDTFDSVADNSVLQVGGNYFYINYDDITAGSNFGGGTNNTFVTLTAVPEANAFWLGGAICLVLGLAFGTRKMIGNHAAV